jgi:AcrR family transcriptional regulator
MAKDTKPKIIASALTLYLNGGLDGVSMRKVADHAGLSAMAAYRHFKNKDDLLNHVVMEGFRSFQDYFSRAKAIPDPVASLKLCMTLYADFAQDQPEFYEMMFMGKLHSSDSQLEQRCQQQIQMALVFLGERVKKCVSSGLIREVDSKACALRLWSLCHGMVSLQVLGELYKPEGFREFYRLAIEQFFIELDLH